jgi:riboflavin biosynthesis pyrimidine reductase
MRAALGVEYVVSEAGGGLNGALLPAGLIDELHPVILPTAIGGKGVPTLFDDPSSSLRIPNPPPSPLSHPSPRKSPQPPLPVIQ